MHLISTAPIFSLRRGEGYQKIFRMMKLTTLLLTIVCLQVFARVDGQRVTLLVKNADMKEVLRQIQKQTGLNILVNEKVWSEPHKITLKVNNLPVDEVLNLCFKNNKLSYKIVDGTIVVSASPELPNGREANMVFEAAFAVDVKGRIVDEQGQPLAGASIRVKDNDKHGIVSNKDGYFTLNDIPDKAILVISFAGYSVREIAAAADLGNIQLKPDVSLLNDIVVTGYTTYTRNKSSSASSIVTADKINDVAGLTVDQILQGRVPGMNVISSSGQPGQSASVVIRGIGSINGSSAPLFILDGIPIESNYFQTINPEDIESATVLKDASAKALYGSRGANGVVVLTTKKGKAGKVSVQYNSQYGFSNLSRPNFIMMNTAQRLEFEEEAGLVYNRSLGPGWTYSPKNPAYASGTDAFRKNADHILDSLRNVNVDWRDFFFRRGKFQEQQLSLSGGNENVKFYSSLNYYNQDGVAVRTGLKRYSLRNNLDVKSGNFTAGVNLSIGYSNSSFTEGEASTSVGTAMSGVYYALPYEYPYAPDGTLVHPGNRSSYFILDQREGSVALERLLNSSNKTDQLKTILGISLGYQILPELKISTRAGIDYRNSTDLSYINPDSYYGSRSVTNTLGGKGRFDEGTRRNFNIVTTTGLTFNKTLAGAHEIEASGFYEYVYNNFNSFGFTGFGIDGRLPETPAGITNGSATYLPATSGSKTRSALASFMGIGRYTFNGKYTVTGSYRYDGSTKVALTNKWHGFYSLGASWAVKNETFLKNVPLINDLKARISYGTTASPLNSDFGYLATYGAGTSYGTIPGIRPTAPGNPNYDWEYVNEFNTGFDLAFFKTNRLRITADYYNRITSNMFFDQPLSLTSGFASLAISTGKMRNRGVEAEVSGDIVKNKSLTWTIGMNFGYNKNKILQATPLADQLPDGDTRVIKVGMPYGTYYAPDWAGVNPQTGEAQYYNLDGTITTTYNVTTQSTTNSGGLYPSLTGGFTTAVSWKGFSVNALFAFVTNVKRWNNEDLYNENQRYATSNQSVRMLYDRWKKPGDNAILQRFDIPRNFTSKDIQDASFLRLRNLSVAYNLPQATLKSIGFVKSIKLFVQGQNLLTWTSWRGLDPENNSVYGRFQYPNTRTYTAGLNVNF